MDDRYILNLYKAPKPYNFIGSLFECLFRVMDPRGHPIVATFKKQDGTFNQKINVSSKAISRQIGIINFYFICIMLKTG
jgi:hypothetical protein